MITLSNAGVVVVLDPSRGGEITWIGREGGENALAHEEWVSPLPPSIRHQYATDEANWMAGYRGGWQFLFPNAGAASVASGVEVAFHGEASLAPVRVVETSAASCRIITGARLPLELTRTVSISASGAVQVEEQVRNIGASECAFVWGHHPVFPIHESTVIDVPAKNVAIEPAKPVAHGAGGGTWPILVGEDGVEIDLRKPPAEGDEHIVYLTDLPSGWAAARHPGTETPGVALAWSTEAYPHLWLWAQRGGDGFPFYGRARMLGLETQRAWPFDGLSGAIERGQAVNLLPGELADSWISLTLLDGDQEVTGVSRDGVVRYG